MPVDSKHPAYTRRAIAWARTRAAIEGEDSIRERGTEFLPRLEGQNDEEYAAYSKRASWYGATGRTKHALVGAIWRKPPTVKFPGGPDVLKKIARGGRTLDSFSHEATGEGVGVGRLAILVDAPNVEGVVEPYLALYKAENLINWQEGQNAEGVQVPVEIVLREEVEVRTPEDPFETKAVERFRVLKLGTPTPPEGFKEPVEAWLRALKVEAHELSKPIYYQEIWIKKEGPESKGQGGFILQETIVPRMRGGRLWEEIPCEIANVTKLGLQPEEGVLEALASVNIGHFRNAADLEHGAHFTALPTPYVTGVDPTGGQVDDSGNPKPDPATILKLGSTRAWLIANPAATLGFLEYSGAGLGSIRDLMSDKKKEMASLGARLLEEKQGGVEAAETLKIRQAGEGSVLSALAGTLSLAIERSLQRLAKWRTGGSEAEVSFKLNQDFGLAGVDSALLNQAMLFVQGGLWSFQVFYAFCEKHELYPPGWTIEKESRLIVAGPPRGLEEDREVPEDEDEPSDEEEPKKDDGKR